MKFLGKFLAALLVFASTLHADELRIAAANNLVYVIDNLAANFEKATGNKVTFSLGSSGNIFAQIENGAPVDVFLSADMDYPKKLEDGNLVEPGTLYRYATGRVAIWVRSDSALDLSRGFNVLNDASIRHIAIANPKLAPYGRAAVAVLTSKGLYDNLQNKLVFGENVSQALQFVESGNAEVGIVALSQVCAPDTRGKGRYFVVPADLHPTIDQGVVVVRASSKKDLAKQFVEFLKTPDSKALLKTYGFEVPEDSPKPNVKDQKGNKK